MWIWTLWRIIYLRSYEDPPDAPELDIAPCCGYSNRIQMIPKTDEISARRFRIPQQYATNFCLRLSFAFSGTWLDTSMGRSI
jgi:hypothetical protein